jgi:glycosyltransferase involved in cell wall biosynthesis
MNKYDAMSKISSLISIIVPVYKTEIYLHKCLNSIVNQTYKNLEIILIDDGSPDNCGKICDEYAAQDSRIKVMHQKNEGLSASRNAGLKIASGEYIGFVDSDDWIDLGMYEILHKGVEEYESQIAICGYYDVVDNKLREVREKDTILCRRDEAIHHLILDKTFSNHAWNKLYKRELFDGVFFPHGRAFEDIATTYKLFEKAQNIVCLNSSKYYYLHRKDSIIGDKTIKSRADRCIMIYERYIDLIKRYPQEKELLLSKFFKNFADLGSLVSRQSQDGWRTSKNYIEEIHNFANENKRGIWKCRYTGMSTKLYYILFLRGTWTSFAGIRFIAFILKAQRKIIFFKTKYVNKVNLYLQKNNINLSI